MLSFQKKKIWRVGTSIRATIEEILDDATFIVSLDGQLLRVRNETHLPFRKGEQIHLIVHGVSPLEMQLDPRFYNQRSFERFA